MGKNFELAVFNSDTAFFPEDPVNIVWETARKNVPGMLRFSLVDGGEIPLAEGDRVRLSAGGEGVFFGFVFRVERGAGVISAVCYDQLRYLKNRDSYVYEMKTASEVVRMIAADHGLTAGAVEDTGYRIPSRVECSNTLFDIIGNALDITMSNTGRTFVLFDDCGKLSLRSPDNLRADIVIDKRCAESFELCSSIDSGVYNRVKLAASRENSREFSVASDNDKIKRWGLLQFCSASANAGDPAALLGRYSKPELLLNINNAAGDFRVRGGSAVAVDVVLGAEHGAVYSGTAVHRFVRVERARHVISHGVHLMSLVCNALGA